MRHKLIIFDFDGTLADTFPSFVHVFDEAADKYGFNRLDRAQHHTLRGADARQIMAHHAIPLWKVPAIARFMRAGLAADIDNIKLFAGVAQALRSLSAQGVVLTIVSSNSLGNVRAVLGLELAALFSHLECGASLFGKLAKVRKVLAATGIAPQDTMLIGDEIRDAKAAADAGVDFGAVAWGFNHVEALAACAPRQVFHQVAEMAGASAQLRQG